MFGRGDAPEPLDLDDVLGGPEPGAFLADLSDLPDHGGAEVLVALEGSEEAFKLVVQRIGDGIQVFENRCPHAGTPLNLFEPNFMDISGKRLICRTHGALFDPEDGYCVRGPCKGQYLRKVAVEIRNGKLYSASTGWD